MLLNRYEDWVLEDPTGQDPNHVLPISDEIRRRVTTLMDELNNLGAPTNHSCLRFFMVW